MFLNTHPFSEKEISVMGPECPGNLATLAPSLRSQIFITLEHQHKIIMLMTSQTNNENILDPSAYKTKFDYFIQGSH